MAKKPQKQVPLTLTEIILRGDAETIRQALEARIQIDVLLEEREAAYQRIAELEAQVCEIVGEDGAFPFPEPPMPVADFTPTKLPKKTAPKVSAKPSLVAKPTEADEQSTAAVEAKSAPNAPKKETSEDVTKTSPQGDA